MTDYTSIDPQKIEKLSKENLLDAFLQTRQAVEDATAQQSAIKEILLDKIEGSGEVVGHYTVSIAQRMSYFPGLKTKEKLEKARGLGAIKEAVDNSALKKLWTKGVEVPHTATRYVIVKEIQEE